MASEPPGSPENVRLLSVPVAVIGSGRRIHASGSSSKAATPPARTPAARSAMVTCLHHGPQRGADSDPQLLGRRSDTGRAEDLWRHAVHVGQRAVDHPGDVGDGDRLRRTPPTSTRRRSPCRFDQLGSAKFGEQLGEESGRNPLPGSDLVGSSSAGRLAGGGELDHCPQGVVEAGADSHRCHCDGWRSVFLTCVSFPTILLGNIPD